MDALVADGVHQPAGVLAIGGQPQTELGSVQQRDDPEQAGVPCQVVYLPVELSVQLACIAHRQAKTPNGTFPMPQAAVVLWRNQFQAPDAAELAGEEIPCPSPGWSTWLAWAVDRWPTLDPHAT